MDNRCYRKLTSPPEVFCPLAIARIRWMDALNREPTEEEELDGPGCPYFCKSHSASYCFFKLLEQLDEPMTETQIAHQLGISEQTVKKTKSLAISKMAKDPSFIEMKELYGEESVIEEKPMDPYESEYLDMSIGSISDLDLFIEEIDPQKFKKIIKKRKKKELKLL